MGMSASQARLLSLTARQHDIELRAQKVQADKLRLANDSDKVYLNYLNALNATKVQYMHLNTDGSKCWSDATLAILENGVIPNYQGETSPTTYLIQNAADGKVYITEDIANQFGIQGGTTDKLPPLDEFLENQGCTKEPTYGDEYDDYTKLLSVNPVGNVDNGIDPNYRGYSLDPLKAPVENPGHENLITAGTEPEIGPGEGEPQYIPESNNKPLAAVTSTEAEEKLKMDGDITVGTETEPPKPATTGYLVDANPVQAVNVAPQPSSSVPNGNITKITILNNGYQTLKSMTYTFDPADLNKTYSELSGVNIAGGEVCSDTCITINYGNKYGSNTMGSPTNTEYFLDLTFGDSSGLTTNSSLKDILSYLVNKANQDGAGIDFDSKTGTLTSSDEFYFTNINTELSDYFINNRTVEYNDTQYIDINTTKMVDIVKTRYNYENNDDGKSLEFNEDPSYQRAFKISNLAMGGMNADKNVYEMTVKEYLDTLATDNSGFSYYVDTENNNNIVMVMDDGKTHTAYFYGVEGKEPEVTPKTIDTYNVEVDMVAVAKNLTVAMMLTLNQSFYDNPNNMIMATDENYDQNYNNSYGNIYRDLNKLYQSNPIQLAYFAEKLNTLMADFDITDCDPESRDSDLKRFINRYFNQPISDKTGLVEIDPSEVENTYEDETLPDGSIKKYNVIITNSGPGSSDPVPRFEKKEDPSKESENGKITGASTEADIIAALAYSMAGGENGKKPDFDACKTAVEEMNLSRNQLVSLAYYYGNKADWDTIINILKDPNDDITSYDYVNQYNDYEITPNTENVVNVYPETVGENKITSAPNVDSILDALAYGMYNANNSTEWADFENYRNELVNLFGYPQQGNSINQLISLSEHYGNDAEWNAIIRSLLAGTIPAQYSEKYSGYTIADDAQAAYDDNSFKVTKNDVSPTKGILNVATKPEMIDYLAYKLCQDYSDLKFSVIKKQIEDNYNDSYKLAELILSYETYKEDLSKGVDVNSSLGKQINSTKYELNEKTDGGYSVKEGAATPNSVTVSYDDVLDRLAYDVYDLKVGRGIECNPNDIKTELSSKYNNTILASINWYYSYDPITYQNIVDQLAQGNTPTISEHYENYDIKDSREDNIQIEQNNTGSATKSLVDIPLIEQIASNLVVAFRKLGKTVDANEVVSKLKALYDANNDANNLILANINNIAYEYLKNDTNVSDIENIYEHVMNNGALNIYKKYSSLDAYSISRINMRNCEATYEQKRDQIDEDWKKDATYYEALKKYQQLQQLQNYQFVIVSDELAHSKKYLSNQLLQNEFVLLKFDGSTIEISEMKDTNIAVEVSLQEVADTENLKKAEAQYEADMRKINNKDKKYDTDLAALEQERNAIKIEVDTLKTVIKDNVDRTFKLFS